MIITITDNHDVDPITIPGTYFRVTWVGDEGPRVDRISNLQDDKVREVAQSRWRAIRFHCTDPRLVKFLDAVEELKREIGVYPPES